MRYLIKMLTFMFAKINIRSYQTHYVTLICIAKVSNCGFQIGIFSNVTKTLS